MDQVLYGNEEHDGRGPLQQEISESVQIASYKIFVCSYIKQSRRGCRFFRARPSAIICFMMANLLQKQIRLSRCCGPHWKRTFLKT